LDLIDLLLKSKSFFFLFVTMTILVFSCHAPREHPPIPLEKMQAVLLDIQLAEAYSVGLNKDTAVPVRRYDKNYDSLAAFYSDIFAHYHLSFNDFNMAMAWYKARPNIMDSLISGVIEELNKEKAKSGVGEGQPEPKKTLPDSNQTKIQPNPSLDSLPAKDSGKNISTVKSSMPGQST